jgi:hypothetical protein
LGISKPQIGEMEKISFPSSLFHAYKISESKDFHIKMCPSLKSFTLTFFSPNPLTLTFFSQMYVSSSLRGSLATKCNSPNFSGEYGGNGYQFGFVNISCLCSQ